ncbi:Chitobiase [Thalassocella blandensis]|nr:Chitobiase [Thalassocella blandensis]
MQKKMLNTFCSALAIFLFSVSCYAKDKNALNYQRFVENAEVRFGVVNNFYGSDTFQSFLEIDNRSEQALPNGDGAWALYFHFVRRIQSVDRGDVTLDHLQGDLYRITPKADFAGLKPGEKLRLTFLANAFISSNSYFMPNVFLVDGKSESYTFKNTATESIADYIYPLEGEKQVLRFNQPADKYSVVTPESRYEQQYKANVGRSVISIVPTPKELHVSKGRALLDNTWSLQQSGGLRFETNYLQEKLSDYGLTLATTTNPEKQKTIVLRVGELSAASKDSSNLSSRESYELDVTSNKITISGVSKAGVFYGIQSLLNLLPAANQAKLSQASEVGVPAIRAFDEPRYSWRGMHYDIARNFHGKQAIFVLLEQMGRYKLNRLHLHLTDDEGWRIEIPGLPELTRVGADRCFDLSERTCLLTQLGSGPKSQLPGSGFLTRDDYVDIIRFAADRNITVIPEIDMPGHSRAAIVAMKARYHTLLAQGKKAQAQEYLLSDPQDASEYRTVQNYTDNAINVCLDSTYKFVGKVVYELQKMHRDAGAALDVLHIGGDEVGRGAWEKSPACLQLFQREDTLVMGVDDLKAHFVRRVSEMTERRGISIMGWEDGLMYDKNTPFSRETLPSKQIIANAWDNIWENGVADRAYLLANAGYDVVLSSATHLYFDHPYETHPEDRGYHWATRFIDLKKLFAFMPDDLYLNADRTFYGNEIHNLDRLVNKVHTRLERPEHILGMQGQLWSETVRTQQQMEKMIFPRLIALAERAWHKADWEGKDQKERTFAQDWAGFLESLVTKDLPKLEQQGVQFYLPPPGAKIVNESLFANSLIPGIAVEFSLDEGKNWHAYTSPLKLKQIDSKHDAILIRTRIGSQFSRELNMPLKH